MPETSAPSVAPAPVRPVQVVAVPFDDARAVALRAILTADLDARYGSAEPEPAAIANARAEALRVHPEQLVATLLAVTDAGDAVGHVMLRRLGSDWEIKRLIVAPEARGAGAGRRLVQTAIDLSRKGGAARVILQTGSAQPESLALYRSLGFTPIPVYEPYVATMPNSLCFELVL